MRVAKSGLCHQGYKPLDRETGCCFGSGFKPVLNHKFDCLNKLATKRTCGDTADDLAKTRLKQAKANAERAALAGRSETDKACAGGAGSPTEAARPRKRGP